MNARVVTLTSARRMRTTHVCTPGWMMVVLLLSAAVGVFGWPDAAVAQQMPDPKEIAGIPLPVADVAVGTVVVRVIRGTLANNLPGQQVELLGAGSPRTVTTDASGRAEFPGLAPGTRVTAVTTIQGERLQSQEFPVPAAGGTRLLLVATDPETEKRTVEDRSLAAGPVQTGMVVLGHESRFVFEFGDGTLSVFNILQLENTARAPVNPPQPIVFDLPAGATGTSILKDSSPQATAAGLKVTVAGPFAPGVTNVQFAYSMPYSGSRLTVEQAMPVPLNRLIVLAQKIVPDMRLSSAQMTEQREMPAEGQLYIIGQGPAVRAGDRVSFDFANLPHEAKWPRYAAVGLAVLILAAGWWGSTRVQRPDPKTSGQDRLEKRRSQLFSQLTLLEEQHRAGGVDPQKYAERRAELVAALERVYAEIDRQAA